MWKMQAEHEFWNQSPGFHADDSALSCRTFRKEIEMLMLVAAGPRCLLEHLKCDEHDCI